MKPYFTTVLIASLLTPISGFACWGGSQTPEIASHVRFYPIVGDKTSHWPENVKAVVGSFASFMVPADTTIEINQRKDGPLSLMNDDQSSWLMASRYVVPAWEDIEFDQKKFKWIHLAATSYGPSEINMHSKTGWDKSVKFDLGYQSETEKTTKPPALLTLVAGEEKLISVDAYDNIEATVAGKVSDGWSVSSPEETGFTLIRIQMVEPTYTGTTDIKKSDPQVRLFFQTDRNPQNSVMTIHQDGKVFGKTYKFRIKAQPTPAC